MVASFKAADIYITTLTSKDITTHKYRTTLPLRTNIPRPRHTQKKNEPPLRAARFVYLMTRGH